MQQHELGITGAGVISAIGQGKTAFVDGLLAGSHAFGVMQRPGRQRESSYLGAEVPTLRSPRRLAGSQLRTASFSAQLALMTIEEAWRDACLDDVDPARIGLIVGGSNLQQREARLLQDWYVDKPQFLRPTYGMTFMDTDLCGVCTAEFGIRGAGYTVGGASASGQLAIIQAVHAVRSGQLDVCIALGAMMDLSYWECQGLRALGAMGSDKFAAEPDLACRPFDKDHDGFIYGECCGAVVVERIDAVRTGKQPYAFVAGCGMSMDGNRNPNPSLEGETRAIQSALACAGWSAADVDYINPHGTGSLIGDETELQALSDCGLRGAHINATKSLIGHGLAAAGAVEVVATLLQMQAGKLHPTRNLDEPLDASFNWVREVATEHRIERALTLSMGFGGMNTAICLERYE